LRSIIRCSPLAYFEDFVKLRTGVEVYHRCWTATNSKGLIVGVHGFAEHGGRYEHVGKFFADNSYDFCIMDLRGHGRTAEKTLRGYVRRFEDYLDDLEAYIEYMLSRTGHEKVHLLGHSMGGLIAVHYAGYVGKSVKTIITSGAGVYLATPALHKLLLILLSVVLPMKRLALPIDPRELSTDPEVGKRYVEDPLVFKDPTIKLLAELVGASRRVWRYIEKIAVPALILHGADDKIVPIEASKRLYSTLKIQDKVLKVYPNMKHEILNERAKQEVLNDILNWLQDHR